jgi:hypothetical protein
MSNLKFLFRADETNVGDWWSPPFKYFPFKEAPVGDILDVNFSLTDTDILIIGGGGVGTEYFRPHLKRIANAKIKKTVLWGGGVDTVVDQTKKLENSEYDLYGDFYDFIDIVGIRVFSTPQNFRYIPCASCMSDLFFKYRDVKPTKDVGYYNHKRVSLSQDINHKLEDTEDNNGSDLEAKLRFLSDYRYIITNSYHGIYWATLLGKKVITVPFKSGLLSFKYKPIYSWDGVITDDLLHSAKAYSDVLEESQKLNLDFYYELRNSMSIT